jgi:Tol biopolymer transport system component
MNRPLKRSLKVALLLALLSAMVFPALPAAQAQGTPRLTVVSETRLDLRAYAAWLSPDGALIAYQDSPRQFCVLIIALNVSRCAELRGEAGPREVDPTSVRWSPDSTRLVFTESFFRNFNEPDIWVMNALTATLTNLTPDDSARFRLEDLRNARSIDVAPAWSADSTQIAFLRYFSLGSANNGGLVAAVFTVPADGGPAEQRTTVLIQDARFFYSLDWAVDGERVLLNLAQPSREYPQNGLWVTNLGGGGTRQLLRADNLVGVRFSADGRFAMGQDIVASNESTVRGGGNSTLITTLDGREVRLDGVRGAHFGGWSPTGASVVYVVRSAQEGLSGLYIAPEPGAEGYQIYAGRGAAPTHRGSGWDGMIWAANNTILVTDGPDFVLLRLGVAM